MKVSEVHSDFKVIVDGKTIVSKVDDHTTFDFVVSDPDVMPLARPIPGTSGAKGSGKNDGAHQVKDAIAEALKKKAEA